MASEIEIGYVCSKGHYVFKGDEDACGTKRVAGVFVRMDEDLDLTDEQLQEYVDDSQASVIRKIEFWRNG